MELHECINFLLNRAQQTVAQTFKEQLMPYDITPVQYAILKCLWEEHSLSPKQLAVTIGIDSPAITGTLDRLEAKGLVERQPDENDRRSLRIFLTEKSQLLEKPINTIMENTDRMILQDLSEQECAQLKTLLAKLGNM